MSRSVPFFIGIIIASLVLLAGLAILAQRLTNQSAQISAPVQKSGPTTAPKRAFTSLSAISSKEAVVEGESFTIAIHINTGENTVTGAQLELYYDPAVLTVTEVTPGDFFAKPIIYANKNDTTKGDIVFAVGSFDGKQGTGKVALVKATALKPSSGEVLHIKPTTIITELSNKESVLNERKGANLVIR